MKASTKRILSFGFAGILFISVLVVYANLIKPELGRISVARAQLFSKSQSFNEQATAVKKVKDLIGKLKGAEQLDEVTALALPLETEVPQVLNQIQAISDFSQVRLTSFSIKPKPFESDKISVVRRIGVLEANISISGPYESIKKFIQSLETNVRIFNLSSFQISASGGATGISSAGDFYNGIIKAEVYYQEQNE